MPEFVILKHSEKNSIHYDIMLEKDGTLLTWKTINPPSYFACHPLFATKIDNHRLKYLNYEGEISNDRGRVEQWDKGIYEKIEWSENKITVRLKGQKG